MLADEPQTHNKRLGLGARSFDRAGVEQDRLDIALTGTYCQV